MSVHTTQAADTGTSLRAPEPREVVATFPTYGQAQAAVDRLSDAKFDVSTLRIVGHDIRSVEYVTGRMTTGRAALAGLAGGAWWGLFLGILFGLFAPVWGWLQVLLFTIVVGAGFGAVFGVLGHLASGGRRDFTSVQGLEAERYDVTSTPETAGEATRRLAETG